MSSDPKKADKLNLSLMKMFLPVIIIIIMQSSHDGAQLSWHVQHYELIYLSHENNKLMA